jgi:glycosyltransferase involved in cell wall biosynthesis
MRVGIIAPHPAPLAIGGAENLFWGLQQAIIHAGHECEVIGHVSPERNLDEVLTSYLEASRFEVGSFDCVITGKYPSWMVRHPDHRIYLLHRLRGLYDTYSGGHLPPELARIPAVAALRPGGPHAPMTTDRNVVLRSVETLFAMGAAQLPAHAWDYPGPLARELIHALDACAFNNTYIRRFAAISKTVATRAGYFPPGSQATVLYPPPHRSDYSCGGGDYFFTSSRLDAPKRLALLIEAMALFDGDVPLLIAGVGPERDRLENLAAGDPRIRFLGFVPDDQMPSLYRDALAVPFIPIDEDYGLVTLEAMKSSKPVLTTRDSGGPCEFVEHERTGLICEPTPISIAAGLRRLYHSPAAAEMMGRAAAELVKPVTWEHVAEGLVGQIPRRFGKPRRRRKKIVLATTMPIYPPQGGGQARVYHLYRNLAKDVDVSIVSFGAPGDPVKADEIAPNLTEIRVGKSLQHDRLERKLMAAMSGIPVTDVAMPRLSTFTPAYRETLHWASRDCDAFIACHPYLIGEIESVRRRQPIWFEAQDVEVTLKRHAFESVPGHERIIADVIATERRCWTRSQFVFGCTQTDLTQLKAIYGSTNALSCEVPNGVALDEVRYTPLSARRLARAALGHQDQALALFLGSWHPPNLDAVEQIISMSKALPQIQFLVAGSAGVPFKSRDVPRNISFLGPVSQQVRDILLASVDIALNPMSSGTGSNLKMVDYFAAGIPVISTPFGARGLPVRDREHLVISNLENFEASLAEMAELKDPLLEKMTISALNLVTSQYSWDVIAEKLIEFIEFHDLLNLR